MFSAFCACVCFVAYCVYKIENFSKSNIYIYIYIDTKICVTKGDIAQGQTVLELEGIGKSLSCLLVDRLNRMHLAYSIIIYAGMQSSSVCFIWRT